jgi:hypothetical protein
MMLVVIALVFPGRAPELAWTGPAAHWSPPGHGAGQRDG